MIRNLSHSALASLLSLAFLLPGVGHTANVTVGCPGGSAGDYPSINAALSAIGQTGPSTIVVTGTCNENVTLFLAQAITIVAGSAGATIVGPPNANVFDISRSHAITLQYLQIVGNPGSTNSGSGVFLNTDSHAPIVGCYIHDNRGGGVTLNGRSSSSISNTIIQNNNPGSGLQVTDHSNAYLTGTTIQNNGLPVTGGIGVFVQDGSSVVFNRKNLILNNADFGVFAQALSSVRLQQGPSPDLSTTVQGHNVIGIAMVRLGHLEVAGAHVITGNGSGCPFEPIFCGGIFAGRDSTVNLGGGAAVSGNQGPGISVQQGANLALNGANISNNSGDGVHLELNSIGDFFATNAITGNKGASVFCDERSLVIGSLTGISNIECEHVQRKPANPEIYRGFF